jgi:hypothetical protein
VCEISADSRWVLAARATGEGASSAAALVPAVLAFGSNLGVMADQPWIGDIWNAETGKHHFQIGGPSSMACHAFSPNGRYLAVGMRNGLVRICDIDAQQELFDWKPPLDALEAPFMQRHLAFTADSTKLVTAVPNSPALLLLDLNLLNRQLAEVGLPW